MWSNNVTSSRKGKNTLSCVYRSKSHTNTLKRETGESFVCVRKGFVSVPGSRRVWWPFPTSVQPDVWVRHITRSYNFFPHFFSSFYFPVQYVIRDALYSAAMVYNIIAWNFLIVPYTTVLYTRRNRISHSPASSRVYLTPCETPIISPKHCVEAVNISLRKEKKSTKKSPKHWS